MPPFPPKGDDPELDVALGTIDDVFGIMELPEEVFGIMELADDVFGRIELADDVFGSKELEDDEPGNQELEGERSYHLLRPLSPKLNNEKEDCEEPGHPLLDFCWLNNCPIFFGWIK